MINIQQTYHKPTTDKTMRWGNGHSKTWSALRL